MGHYNSIGAIIGAIIIFSAYFAPSIVAKLSKKNNTGAILVLNLLLGWTIIGWIVAFIWAVSKDVKPQNIVISNSTPEKKETNNLEQLQKLKELLDNPAITAEEYEFQKNKILNS